MKELSRELAWAFITSYSFVMSIHQWDKRKKCYDSLMALWHKLHLEGHDLVFFRMAEMQYFSYLQHAPELDLNEALILYPQAKNRKELVNEIFKFPPLKAESDLCDGEIIDLARIGSRVEKSDIRTPVIGITLDEHLKLDQRAGIFLRSLLDLKRCVHGWSVKPCPGRLFSLNIEKDGTIRSAHRLLLGD